MLDDNENAEFLSEGEELKSAIEQNSVRNPMTAVFMVISYIFAALVPGQKVHMNLFRYK